MARLTINQINTAIKQLGIEAELFKGSGYYYFAGNDVDLAKSTSVYVYRLNELSLDEWLAEAKDKSSNTQRNDK